MRNPNGLRALRRRLLILAAVLCVLAGPAARRVRASEIRDLADVRGVRSHHLVGYGLVVGLRGTGDSSPGANRMLRRLLARGGLTLGAAELSGRSVAVVVVTAQLRPFLSGGQSFDVNVSAVGDATSLAGGRLVSTPLYAGDPDNVYARAQGAVRVYEDVVAQASGARGSDDSSERRAGRGAVGGVIRGGGVVEREAPLQFVQEGRIWLALRRPDLVQAQRVAEAVLQGLGATHAKPTPVRAIDGGLVEVRIPPAYKDDPVAFLSEILRYPVDVEAPARIVVNQATGTVAMSAAVRVQPCAFAHGDLMIRVGRSEADETDGSVVAIRSEITLRELTAQLNRIGIGPRDLIAVIEQLVKLGAINAELVME